MTAPFTESLALLAAKHLPVAMLTLDSQGRVVHAQCAYWQSLGFLRATHLEGKLIGAVLPGSNGEQSWLPLDRAWEEGEVVLPGIVAGGRTLDAFARVEPRDAPADDEQRWCYLLLWDRTEQQAQQIEAEAARETLHQFTSDLPAMLYQTQGNEARTDLTLPYLSDSAESFTGYSKRELQQKPGLILESIHPEDRRSYYERALVAMAQLTTFQIDMRLVSADDETSHWVRVISHPRLLADKSIRFTGVAVAIDDLVEQLEALRHSRDEMGQFTHERFQTLIETKRCLEQEIRQREQVHAELLEEQRTLKKMLELQDHQRRFLSYDLHDGFIQEVIGAKMILEGTLAVKEPNLVDLGLARDSLERAIEEVRRMIADLRPLAIETEGLIEAVESLCENARSAGLEITLQHNLDGVRFSSELESHVYRMVQESLSNVRKHAATEKASVVLWREGNELSIQIEDCGVGFEPDEVSGLHFGLEGMRQRARMLRGVARVTSQPSQGTRVAIRLPLES